MNRTLILLGALLLTAGTVQTQAADEVILQPAGGVNASGQIRAGIPVTFEMFFNSPDTVRSATNGFRIYSPDGAVWTPPIVHLDVGYLMATYWDLTVDVSEHSADGNGEDTLGFYCYSLSLPGLPPNTTEPLFSFSFTAPESEIGKTICIDSSFFQNAGVWLWLTSSGESSSVPEWGGTLCYEVVSCCSGTRGNVNDDPDDNIFVNDLSALVDFLFKGGEVPACSDEADVNGNGATTVSDLTYLVDYLHRGGPAPPACP